MLKKCGIRVGPQIKDDETSRVDARPFELSTNDGSYSIW